MKTSKTIVFSILLFSALLAFNACDAGGEIISDANSPGSGGGGGGGTTVDAPTGLSATKGVYNDAIGLTWDLVDEATAYKIYRSESPDGTYTEIAEIDPPAAGEDPEEPEEPEDPVLHTEFTSDVDLTDGITIGWIAFKIGITIGTTIEAEVSFPASFLGTNWDRDEIIENINTSVGSDVCSAVDGAEGGEYIYFDVDDEPVILENAQNLAVNKFLIDGVESGEMVIINADGIEKINEDDYTGNPEDYRTATSGSGGTVVENYYYEDTDVAADVYYYYKVQTIQDADSSELSYYDYGFAGEMGEPTVPQNVQASDGDYSVTITWDASANTQYYRVYISETENGEYTAISGNVYNTSYVYSGSLTPETTYYFRVNALNDSYESGLSEADSGYVILAESITDREFLQLYLDTEERLMEKIYEDLGDPPMGSTTAIGDTGGTCDYSGGYSGVTVTYNDYCEFTAIFNGTTETEITISVIYGVSGDTTGTLTLSGMYPGTIELFLEVGLSGTNGGYYVVTQQGSSPATFYYDDLGL